MPRKARKKHSEAIYHIMSRSISEVLLFKDDEDKEYYISLVKKYTELYKCSVYAYILMNNHVHLHLDPKGYDISKFMHSLNTAYVCYYNKRHNRHGHLFQGRFESKIIDTAAYHIAVSAYIHKNAKDIEGYLDKEETYKYSSYGIYLGTAEDSHRLVDASFIRKLFNIKDHRIFSESYYELVNGQRGIQGLEELRKKLSITFDSFENEYDSGRQVILRDKPPVRIMSYIASILQNIAQKTLSVNNYENDGIVENNRYDGNSQHARNVRIISYKEHADDIKETITISTIADIEGINDIRNINSINDEKNITDTTLPCGNGDEKSTQNIKSIKNIAASIYATLPQKFIYAYRAISAYALRVLCGLSYNQICKHLYNITISGCSKLCQKGHELLETNKDYQVLWNQMLVNYQLP